MYRPLLQLFDTTVSAGFVLPPEPAYKGRSIQSSAGPGRSRACCSTSQKRLIVDGRSQHGLGQRILLFLRLDEFKAHLTLSQQHLP